MKKEIETLNFVVEFQDARIAKLVDENKRLTVELEIEKARVKAMQDHVNEIDDFEIAILDALDNRVIN